MTQTVGYSTLDGESAALVARMMIEIAREAEKRAVRVELAPRGLRLFRHAIVAHQMAVVVPYEQILAARYPLTVLQSVIDAMEAQQP